jgi:hemolysin activation/secretion protein
MIKEALGTRVACRIAAPRSHAIFVLGLLLSAAAPAAQIDEAQRLLDEQRARRREEQSRQPRPSIKREEPAAPEFDVRADPAALAEVEPAFDIRRIEIKGDALLDAAEQDAILRPFIGLRLGQNRINLLLRRLTAALIDRGYVTSRAYIGPQNLASDMLEVTLVAGRIEAVKLDNSEASGRALAPLPFRSADTLRLDDLEQGVDQINRLRSSNAEMQILPGQTPGGSVVDIRRKVQDPWRFHLGADNYGQKSTGTLRGRVIVEADNPLGLFDAWNLTHIQSADSKASLLSVSVPWGYSTLSYIYTVSDYSNPIPAVAVITGDSANHSFAWNRVIQRDAASKTALDAMLTLRRFQRDVAGVSLAPGHERTAPRRQPAAALAGRGFERRSRLCARPHGLRLRCRCRGAHRAIPALPV